MMKDLASKFTMLLHLILAGLITSLVACSSSSSAPPAPPSKSEDGEYGSKSKNLKTGDKSSDDEDDEDDEDSKDEDDEEEEETAAFNFGGAEIGDKEVQDAVKKCHDSEKFYNRFDDEEELGKCTKLKLARVDCDAKGLKKILSDKQKKTFEDALDDDSSAGYKGWKIDQCLDCEKDNDEELCKNSSGKALVGTKVFFVKENGTDISGKSMGLPVRPGQSSSKDDD